MTSSADSITAVADRMRREKQARARSLLIQLAVFVVLPTLLATAYFGVVASHRYDSSMLVAIRSGVNTSREPASDPTKDAAEIVDYVSSHDALNAVASAVDFDDTYTSGDIDWFARLSANAGSESRLRYYNRHVSVLMDDRSGHLRISVTAYDPDDAHRVASALLEHLEKQVASLHAKAREDAMQSAQAAVNQAHGGLVDARMQLTKLDTQRLNEPPPGPPSREITSAELELSLAETQYENAVRELSDTRRANLATRRYVEVVALPSKPDQPSGPLRLRNIVTAFVVSLAAYAIGSLLLASVREHARL